MVFLTWNSVREIWRDLVRLWWDQGLSVLLGPKFEFPQYDGDRTWWDFGKIETYFKSYHGLAETQFWVSLLVLSIHIQEYRKERLLWFDFLIGQLGKKMFKVMVDDGRVLNLGSPEIASATNHLCTPNPTPKKLCLVQSNSYLPFQ